MPTTLFDNATHDALGAPIAVRVHGHGKPLTIVGLLNERRSDGLILTPAIAYMSAGLYVGPVTTELLREVWIPYGVVVYVASASPRETSLLDAARQGVAERDRLEAEQARAGLVDLA